MKQLSASSALLVTIFASSCSNTTYEKEVTALGKGAGDALALVEEYRIKSRIARTNVAAIQIARGWAPATTVQSTIPSYDITSIKEINCFSIDDAVMRIKNDNISANDTSDAVHSIQANANEKPCVFFPTTIETSHYLNSTQKISKALSEYTKALEQLVNAKDKELLLGAQENLNTSLNNLTLRILEIQNNKEAVTAAGGVGDALTKGIQWISGIALDQILLADLRSAVTTANPAINKLCIYAATDLRQIHIMLLNNEKIIQLFRIEKSLFLFQPTSNSLNKAVRSTNNTSDAAVDMVDQRNNILTAISTNDFAVMELQRQDPGLVFDKFADAHDQLYIALNKEAPDAQDVLRTLSSLAEHASTLIKALQALSTESSDS